ncbi:MAG: hypothetical protein HKO04_14900 [Silicimonas sp.]|nr:hypothetical protein [Silicimonas sp.]
MPVLVLPADILHREKPLLSGTDPVSLLALLFSILVTSFYLVGLIAQRKPRVGHFGTDSIAMLVAFIFSIAAYHLVS